MSEEQYGELACSREFMTFMSRNFANPSLNGAGDFRDVTDPAGQWDPLIGKVGPVCLVRIRSVRRKVSSKSLQFKAA